MEKRLIGSVHATLKGACRYPEGRLSQLAHTSMQKCTHPWRLITLLITQRK